MGVFGEISGKDPSMGNTWDESLGLRINNQRGEFMQWQIQTILTLDFSP